jgi:hypothetical protein
MTGDLVFQVLQAIKPEIVSRIDSALRATRYPLGILRRSRVWESGDGMAEGSRAGGRQERHTGASSS